MLALDGDALRVRVRMAWQTGSTTRLRSVAVADLDGDGRAEIVAGGQHDAAGRACLGVFALDGDRLDLVSDASDASGEGPGEIKHVLIAADRVLTLGQPADASWHLRDGALVRDPPP